MGVKTLVDMLWNGGMLGQFRFGNLQQPGVDVSSLDSVESFNTRFYNANARMMQNAIQAHNTNAYIHMIHEQSLTSDIPEFYQ
jgi:hypothetical protein